LLSTVKNSVKLSQSIVDEQRNLDAFLISSIGLADMGNDVVGGNRQALTDVLHLLVPTTDLLNEYHQALWCGIAGSLVNLHSPPRADDQGVGLHRIRRRAVPLPDPLAQGGGDRRSTVSRPSRGALRCFAAIRGGRRRRQPDGVRQPATDVELRRAQAAAVRAD